VKHDRLPEGPSIQVVLPAHNEGASIGRTIREFYQVAKDDGFEVSFLVCEDGSTDNTCEVISELAHEIPVTLLSFQERKGYSHAVIDGFRATTADIVGFIDSDGQCDPADFGKLYKALEGHDLVVGYRAPRHDPLIRRVMSGAFGLVYRRLFPVQLKDPSCPFLLIRKNALQAVMAGRLGILRQGFWWEFNARAVSAGLSVVEVPINHRVRTAGTTKVYLPTKVPRLAAEHLRGLVTLRRELRAAAIGDRPAKSGPEPVISRAEPSRPNWPLQ
jgi:glycosyltransferase involved in cell wall biosynthesis